MEEKMELVTSQAEVEVVDECPENVDIRPLIYIVRNKQVMLDSDLAFLYHVETGYLNRARKRNIKRFPEDFSFQLTKEEYEDLKCQIGISSLNEHGGRRTRPYVYTEQGVAMLSAVLKSEVAVTESIRIMKTFVRLRQYLSRDEYLLGKINELEAGQLKANIESQRFIEETNRKFDKVFDYFEQHNERTQTIFFEGQIYDSYSLLSEIVQSANNKIVVIDGYVDVITLNILSKKKKDVYVVVYTLPNSKISKLDVEKFNAQYPTIDVYRTKSFHDRFLIIDSEKGYHIGASLKDAGRKCFGINRIEDFEMIDMLLERAKNSVV